MTFDPCPHQITQLVLKAGAIIRQLKGLPEEKNITILYNETAPLLGIIVQTMSSKDVDHLPSPEESARAGQYVGPTKSCNQCSGKMLLHPLCKACTDAEGGKYKTAWICMENKEHKEKSEKFFTQILNELGAEIPEGMKQTMGIKTLTDEGLK